MSAWLLAAAWIAVAAATALVPAARWRRRLTPVAPLAAAAAALLTEARPWPGPLASGTPTAALLVPRASLGLVAAGALATAATLLLAARADAGQALCAGVVGAAAAVSLGSTVPVVWGCALATAVAALSLRWITVAPGRRTLATGRVAGAGAAILVAGAVLVPAARTATVTVALPGTTDTRAVLAGGLLAAGAAALLGLVPLGGWVAGVVGTLRGADLAPWGLVLAPATLVGASAAPGGLPAASRAAFADTLLAVGLLSAVLGGLQALAGAQAARSPQARYGRVLIADVALAAAGIGTLQPEGRLGALLVVLTHLVCAPLLLNGSRLGLARPRRLAWAALSGLPPAAAFWGRLLVLVGLARVSAASLLLGLVAAALLLVAVVRALLAPPEGAEGPAAPIGTRALAWAVGSAALVLGLAPGPIAERVFGMSFN